MSTVVCGSPAITVASICFLSFRIEKNRACERDRKVSGKAERKSGHRTATLDFWRRSQQRAHMIPPARNFWKKEARNDPSPFLMFLFGKAREERTCKPFSVRFGGNRKAL
jgi:hypothetical protein